MNTSRGQERHDALIDLVELRLAPSVAAAVVRALPWDSEVELVLLSPGNVIVALQRYLRGELSPADLEVWSDAIEGRDDIGMESGSEELLRAFVFETANPSLAEPISESYAHRWLDRLGDGLGPQEPLRH